MFKVIGALIMGTLMGLGINQITDAVFSYLHPYKRFGPEGDRITQELNYKEIDKLSIVSAGLNEVRIARCYSGNRIIFESPIKDFYIDGNGNVNIKRITDSTSFVTKAVCVIQ